MDKATYLKKIDEIIASGKFKDDWASLSTYPVAKWYQKAKFGIFIHWGVYSVPAFGNEWYPRMMYLKDSPEYKHHIETYGPHKEFGYADFVPMFKAEKFDAAEWAELFREAGAKYVMPVAEHHDGFQMYASELSDWNAAKRGPKRDVVGELKTELEKRDITFAASSHRAENFWFFGGARNFDSGLQEITFQEPYGWADPVHSDPDPRVTHEATHDIHSVPPSKAHLEDWLARSCELVDKYQPKIVWFDWWIHNVAFKPYLKKFAAYYYNRSLEWGHEVAINYKYDAFAYTSAVFDIERGQLSAVRPQLWQNDTAIAKNSWGYTENNDFKNPVEIMCDIVDVVSKNGCYLLNVGPKSDGTITDQEQNVLRKIGAWLKINGESIYDTTYWTTFGEGPTEVPDGAFSDTSRAPFTGKDIRYTYKAPYIYANVLKWEGGETVLTALRKNSPYFLGHIEKIEVLGFDNAVVFAQDGEGLKINVDGEIKSDYPVCFRILID